MISGIVARDGRVIPLESPEASTELAGQLFSSNIETLVHLEGEARDIALKIKNHERDQQQIAQRLLELDKLHEIATGSISSLESSFERWFCNLSNVARGSFWRYWNIGIAIKRGLNTVTVPTNSSSANPETRPPSGNELAAAGRALANGATPEEAKKALESGTVRQFSEARANGGTVRLMITESGANEMETAVQKFSRVYARLTNGETLEKPVTQSRFSRSR